MYEGNYFSTCTASIADLALHGARNISFDTTNIKSIHSAELSKYVSGAPFTALATAFALALSDLPSRQSGTEDGLTQNSTVEIQKAWYAYGYCADTTSIRLSLAVIMAYCVITAAYIVYILATGSNSTAWNSAIELVTHALLSKKPNYDGRMAVGIDSLNKFNQGVVIRVNKGNKVELVFAGDRDIGSLGRETCGGSRKIWCIEWWNL
jgi:hypothetical protein